MGNYTMKDGIQVGIKLLLIAAVIVFALWFAFETISILLLFFLTVVLTLVLNAPVMWLVSKKVPRTLAALLVFFLMLIFIVFIGWLVIPKMLEQVTTLVNNLPGYYEDLKREFSRLLSDYPTLQEKLLSSSSLEDSLPSVVNLVTNVGQFSFSLIGAIFLLVMFFSIVAYMLIDPVPLLETYLNFFPPSKRSKAAHALARASNMMVGWMKSNLIVGLIDAVAIFFFLSYMDIPGVWVWVGLAVFAEMIPRLGLYIMMVPPVLIALSINPLTALWVLIFYLLLDEIMGDFVVPKIRASAMNLHPVSSLFVMLAMIAAFGLPGALVATPMTAFIKAYYEEFFLANTTKMDMKENIDIVLKRKI